MRNLGFWPLLAFIFTLSSTSWGITPPRDKTGSSKQALLEQLQTAKSEQMKEYRRLQNETRQIQVDQLEASRKNLIEAKLRTELLDRLIFYTDSHFRGGDERVFLQKATLSLAEREINDPENMNTSLWTFLKHLSGVFGEARGSDLTGVAIIESYLNYSSISEPKDPKNYLQSRDYTNGSQFETAHTVKREEVGEVAFTVSEKTSLKSPLEKPVLKPAMVYEDEITESKTSQ